MKRILSILLVLTYFVMIEGSYLQFKLSQLILQKQIKEELRIGANNKDLFLVIIPLHNDHNIHWVETNEEFTYKGELYDVVKIKIINNNKYIYCLNDRKEEQLIDHYYKSNTSKKSSEKKIIRNFNNKYFPEQSITFNNFSKPHVI